jgi:hypothetical protein
VSAASSWDFRDILKLFAPRWPELVLNQARTRLERGLQQPEHFTLPPWHQHHLSDSLDLLELPQGPALFTECLEWRLPRADQTAFRAAWANLVACLFGWRELRLTATLWSCWQDTPQPRLAPLQLLAALLAEAPERFPLPLRSRCFGEPCPEEVALAAEAQQLDNRLPPGHPARQLYATLRDQAHAAIASAKESDGALVER